MLQINELEELRLKSYDSAVNYKEKMKRINNIGIRGKAFHVGQTVLVFNSRLKVVLGKLKARWIGPYIVTSKLPNGVYEVCNEEGPPMKINGHRLET